MHTLADLRKNYTLGALSETDVDPNPIRQFEIWFEQAVQSQLPEPNVMTLATVGSDLRPSARIVLIKGVDERGFTFFTNYNSSKGMELLENPRACLVFFWKELERQVRISGLVSLVSGKESDDYFNSRPEGSRIGAWASPQSEVIESREWLEKNEEKFRGEFSEPGSSASGSSDRGSFIKRPPHWGGYRVKPTRVEFWQGRPSRLHDRILFSLQGNGRWTIERLAP